MIRRFRPRVLNLQLAGERVSEQPVAGSLFVQIQAAIDPASHQQHAGPGERYAGHALFPRIERLHRRLECRTSLRSARLDERKTQAQGLGWACLRNLAENGPSCLDGGAYGHVIVSGVISARKDREQLRTLQWIELRRLQIRVDLGHDPHWVPVDPRIESAQTFRRQRIVAGGPGRGRETEQQSKRERRRTTQQHRSCEHGTVGLQGGLSRQSTAPTAPAGGPADATAGVRHCGERHPLRQRDARSGPPCGRNRPKKRAAVACRPFRTLRKSGRYQNL